MLVAGLLGDVPGDARAGADEFGDDQVGPGPAQQDALVPVEVGQDARHHHPGDQAGAPGPQGLRRLEDGGFQLAGGVGDDEHLLEQGADDDDGDLGAVVDAQDGHRQGAEGGGRQVAEEFDEGLGQPAQGHIGAGQDAQGHADDGGQHEAPEDDLDAVPQALVQPGRVLLDGGLGEAGVEGLRHFMGRGQIDGVGGHAGGRGQVLFLRVGEFIVELGLVHQHAHLEIVHAAGHGDFHLGMPDEGDVAHQAPDQKRQQERPHGQQQALAGFIEGVR